MEPLRTPLRLHRGVTVVEMLVVLAIIGILSIIVIVSQRSFNRSILVNYTAYDVALTIRSAETFGLSSRVTDQITAQTGYGVHFSTSDLTGFTMFADSNPSTPTAGCHSDADTEISDSPDAIRGDCVYTAGSDEIVNAYSFGNNMRIQNSSGLCTYTPSNNQWFCGQNSLTMTFARPNTKVYFAKNGVYDANITKARVIITNSDSGARYAYICIEQSGAMRVIPSATINTGVCP